MKATCWMGKQQIEVRDVPDPRILNQRDAIVRVTSTATPSPSGAPGPSASSPSPVPSSSAPNA